MARGKKTSRVGGDSEHDNGSLKPALVWDIIQLERNDQLELCNGLELIADQLPDDVDINLYEGVYERLRRNLPIYHKNEEALFERAGHHEISWIDWPPVLKCVRLEHATHDCYVDEVYEYLNVLRKGGSIQDPSTIGYMLRSCFYAIRRHLVWENLIIMPAVKQVLTSDDLNELFHEIERNRYAIGLNMV